MVEFIRRLGGRGINGIQKIASDVTCRATGVLDFIPRTLAANYAGVCALVDRYDFRGSSLCAFAHDNIVAIDSHNRRADCGRAFCFGLRLCGLCNFAALGDNKFFPNFERFEIF